MASALKTVTLSRRQLADVELLRVGGYWPLSGFMCESDYWAVLKHMHLPDGQPWPMPITLAVDGQIAEDVEEGDQVELLDGSGQCYGRLSVEQRFASNKEAEAKAVFRTTEKAHPGVAALYSEGDVLLGGPVAFDRVQGSSDDERHMAPAALKDRFTKLGWTTVVGFQTRNPVHRAHEYIQKVALEIVDGLLLHPLMGVTKEDDMPADIRWKSYQVLVKAYFPSDRVILSALPAAMRYAGPREAVFHALVRRNYGCTHFIVGRDHAGVGDYYGPYDAHDIFKEFDPVDLGITPLFFEHAFWCTACVGMGTAKTCPHDASQHVFLSGTRLRALLSEGRQAPPEFTRPEVAEVLAAAYAAN
jgi:sulfate adenylyltransferase